MIETAGECDKETGSQVATLYYSTCMILGTAGECDERGGEEPEELHQGDAPRVTEQGESRYSTVL